MGVSHHPRRRRHVALTLAAVAILVLASASALRFNPTQQYDIRVARGEENYKERQHITIDRRRRLSGPGSWPPSCRFKCGWCSPCKPVHVTIHPGLKVPLEYYPEAWRCKCGNTLFMP